MKRFAAWSLVVLLGVWGAMTMAADLAISQYADSVVTFKSAANAAEKTGFLAGLVNSDKATSHGAFYDIVRVAETNEISYIRDALKQAKSPAVLLSLGAYLESLKIPFVAEIKKNPKMGPLEVMEFQKKVNELMGPFQSNIEKLQPEITIVAKKNPQALIAALKRVFTEEEAIDSDMVGPVLGIAGMKEDGAALVLKSFNEDEKSGALSVLCKALGPDMVIPALKQCEDPASSEGEREVAGLAIFMLPNIEPVYDKVVEAYRHGRYFKAPEPKRGKDGKATLGIADIMKMATSWWGNTIKSKYRKVEGFVPYVAEKYLAETSGQEKIIELLADIDFGEVAPYFMKLNVAELSKESLVALLRACYVSSSSGLASIGKIDDRKEYKAEKFRVFELLFKALNQDTRRDHKMIYHLSNYLPRNQVAFAKGNVGIMTEEEKKIVIFLCGSADSLLREPLAIEDRKAILGALREGASPDLLRTIDYVSNK